uniref:MCF.2 cell line derived transforming sequence n=2 Tax=Passeriformes TaxID=9126 RepID=A0A8C5JHJ9_JUNHY
MSVHFYWEVTDVCTFLLGFGVCCAAWLWFGGWLCALGRCVLLADVNAAGAPQRCQGSLQPCVFAGGRGKDKAWIITLPDNAGFNQVPEESVARVLTYLTSVPSQHESDTKFILILDRRLDTWTSVKTTLQKIAVSPERGMFCVIQEEITAVTKEGKLLLSSFEEPDSGECSQEQQQERPGDWETVNRLLGQLREMETAFDGFWEKHQLKMEQYLQLWKFEQSFQEVKSAIEFLMGQQAELPDTGDSVPQVKQRLKELESLDGLAQELIGKAQVVILHGHQLAANHHYALNLICQQCNELRHHCDLLAEHGKRKQLHLQRTLELHTRLQQALQCCDEGAYLLANQQMDKCQSKEGAQKALQDIEKFLESSSSYLNYDPQALQDDFESVLTPELKCQLQAVQGKLDSVRSMFESRQCCFRRLLDKHVRPVQLVAPRPETPPRAKSPLFSPKHGKTSSGDHIESLFMSPFHLPLGRWQLSVSPFPLQGYRAEMDNPAMLILLPPVLRNRKDVLFGNMPEIYDFHNKIFLHSLESCLGAPERVGCCFLDRREDFQMYEKYCQNKPRSESLWRQCSESSFFQECQRKLEHKLGLDSYLLKPVQRLTKYQLLLKELLKYSTSCDGVQELQEALVAMLDLLKSVNDSMHQISITGYDGDLSELGKVLMQGSFSVWAGHRKGPTKMKDLARFKPMQRHLFLYEKALVFCKKREEHGDGYDKTSSYSFKHFLKMNAVGITENVKGDHRKFEIWYSGREEVYVVQAQTVDLKMAWLNEIRKILFKQQELIKGTFAQFLCGFHSAAEAFLLAHC